MIHREYGASFKFRSHKWWWDRWWDSSSLWSFGGSMNGFLQALESKTFKKAPTWEVFASIFEVLNEALTEQRFAIKSSSNFNEKKPLKDLDLDVKKVQSKYNNNKTNWRKYSDNSGLAPEKLPKVSLLSILCCRIHTRV